jgi:hypothetical protein
MKVEEILSEWESDAQIDKTELADESLKIPKLHHKYYQILVNEKMTLKYYDIEYKKLRLQKHEFYTQGPSELSKEKGWKLPPKGLILKADIPMYMDGDEDLSKIMFKIDLQKEKIDLLVSIIKTVMNRNFEIKSAIDFIKFSMGA